MAIILNIDTAVETASVCLVKDEGPPTFAINDRQKDHAAWLHPAIQKIIGDEGMALGDLDAVAVSMGPGSYTGLRIGLATAKGLCFALQIPLVPVNTLEMMAYATREQDGDLMCPLIDARRMEVFTAVYDKKMAQLIEPKACIIDSSSFDSLLSSNRMIFSGNGSEKLKRVMNHPNAIFSHTIATAADMQDLSLKYFTQKKFADLAYAEPEYIKEFYFIAR